MNEWHNRNNSVTLPILVPLRQQKRHGGKPDAIFYLFRGEGDTGTQIPAYVLPANAANAVAALDRSAVRPLEKRFGKLPKSHIAGIVEVSKLIDAVRLRDSEKLEQHLAYIRAGAGPDYEAILRKHFKARAGWPGVLGWAFQHLNAVCSLGGLCVWMSNRGAEPMATQGEQLRLGIHAADFTCALMFQLLFQMEESASVAYCERCEKAYIRTKSDQRFCGFRCASRERQARYRQAKQKSRERRTK
jgi:hypothetical protein